MVRHTRVRKAADILGADASLHPSPDHEGESHTRRSRLVTHGLESAVRGFITRRPCSPGTERISRATRHVALRLHWTANVISASNDAYGGVLLLWGIFFGPMGAHATWLVNSATTCGSRRFETRDDSPTMWGAMLTFGKGGTTIIRAPTTRHGLAWYELDLNWMGIRTLQMLGLAWEVKLPNIRQPASHDDPALPAEASQRLAMLERQGQ